MWPPAVKVLGLQSPETPTFEGLQVCSVSVGCSPPRRLHRKLALRLSARRVVSVVILTRVLALSSNCRDAKMDPRMGVSTCKARKKTGKRTCAKCNQTLYSGLDVQEPCVFLEFAYGPTLKKRTAAEHCSSASGVKLVFTSYMPTIFSNKKLLQHEGDTSISVACRQNVEETNMHEITCFQQIQDCF